MLVRKIERGASHVETFAKRPLLPPAIGGCQAQILILKILNVFLWLKFSPSLNLNKIEHFSKVSIISDLINIMILIN
jgi:hypothetical protein